MAKTASVGHSVEHDHDYNRDVSDMAINGRFVSVRHTCRDCGASRRVTFSVYGAEYLKRSRWQPADAGKE